MDTQLVIEEYDSFIALKRFREGDEFLELAAEAARNENDLAGELVITNELIGHYRKNDDEQKCRAAIARARKLLSSAEPDEILTGTTKMKKPMQEKNNQANRGGRKPKADPAVHRYGIKLTSEENSRFERLFAESGMRQKAAFIKKSVFGGKVKVVKIDKATMDYYVRLTEFHRQFQAIGNNYNQVLRAVKNNFGEKRAMALLHKLEKATLELILISKKIILLTQEYEKKWLQK